MTEFLPEKLIRLFLPNVLVGVASPSFFRICNEKLG